MWRHAVGEICVINSIALALLVTSYLVSSRERIAEL